MIFATIGSMLPFDRLVKVVDGWSGEHPAQEVLIQLGQGQYVPKHAEWVRMMRPLEFNQSVESCELMVAHLGMGSFITAMQAGKPVILFPRSLALGEITSDHQRQAADWLRDKPGVWVADDEAALQGLLDAFCAGQLSVPPEVGSRSASTELITHVRQFIHESRGQKRKHRGE